MRNNKLLTNLQERNGHQGETRSSVILGKRFHIFKGSVDVQGIDLMVEIIPETLYELEHSKKKIKVFGIVQCKYFQKNTSLRIAMDYVEDFDGVHNNFFALIHTTDENEKDYWYFFTAMQIKEKFSLVQDKKGDYFYVFRITKRNTFEQHRNIDHSTINDIITHNIKRTSEHRNQLFINQVESPWIKPNIETKNYNKVFFESLKDHHPVDKIWLATHYFDDFRHILAWRMVEKLSFKSKISDHTSYNKFILKSTNQQIIEFFESISIEDEVKIINKKFFIGVNKPLQKAKEIIDKLSSSNIYIFKSHVEKKVSIKLHHNKKCACVMCLYENLNFVEAYQSVSNPNLKIENNYDRLLNGYVLFSLGMYDQAQETLDDALEKSIKMNESVLQFFTQYNLEIIHRHKVQESPIDLYYELLKLPLDQEKKLILKSIGERTLLSDYKKIVDELYLKIKDYKERVNNFSTGPTLDTLRAKIIECYFFFKENRCFITDDFDILFEKYIESCCISYSMKIEYRTHLEAMGDFEVMIMLLYCEPNKLLGFFQRNNISKIAYQSNEGNHFIESLKNFFSKPNIDFINQQIRYVENRTANPDLRRKVVSIYTRACYLLAYLDTEIPQEIIDSFIEFISTMDFTMDEFSPFAHPLLGKPHYFSSENLLDISKVIMNRQDYKSYLLTNTLHVLEEKSFIFDDKSELLTELALISIKHPESHIIRPFIKLLNNKSSRKFKTLLAQQLTSEFSITLYTEAILNNALDNPLQFIKVYSKEIETLIYKQNVSYQDNCNAVTGLSQYKHEHIVEFIILYLTFGTDNFSTDFVDQIKITHPYYNFLLNLHDFSIEDSFDINWLKISTDSRILKIIADNIILHKIVNEQIKYTNDKNILQIFVNYF